MQVFHKQIGAENDLVYISFSGMNDKPPAKDPEVVKPAKMTGEQCRRVRVNIGKKKRK